MHFILVQIMCSFSICLCSLLGSYLLWPQYSFCYIVLSCLISSYSLEQLIFFIPSILSICSSFLFYECLSFIYLSYSHSLWFALWVYPLKYKLGELCRVQVEFQLDQPLRTLESSLNMVIPWNTNNIPPEILPFGDFWSDFPDISKLCIRFVDLRKYCGHSPLRDGIKSVGSYLPGLLAIYFLERSSNWHLIRNVQCSCPLV